jgi:hypothetical protein
MIDFATINWAAWNVAIAVGLPTLAFIIAAAIANHRLGAIEQSIGHDIKPELRSLKKRIDHVNANLADRIDSVNTTLASRIDSVNTSLTSRIDKIHDILTERYSTGDDDLPHGSNPVVNSPTQLKLKSHGKLNV